MTRTRASALGRQLGTRDEGRRGEWDAEPGTAETGGIPHYTPRQLRKLVDPENQAGQTDTAAIWQEPLGSWGCDTPDGISAADVQAHANSYATPLPRLSGQDRNTVYTDGSCLEVEGAQKIGAAAICHANGVDTILQDGHNGTTSSGNCWVPR